MDKIMEKYFDEIFENSFFDDDFKFESYGGWGGIFGEIHGELRLLVGFHHTKPTIWYYDGSLYGDHHKLFDLTPKQYNFYFLNYLIKKGYHVDSVS